MFSIPIGWFGIPGGFEWIIILVIALLIFGKRLPSTMRSVGKSFVEFKKGLKGVDDIKEDIKNI
ncbi:MAG: Sec-independent protein translocase subunit TatA/TatB, partial [Candidatus Scalindua sp.]